MTQTVTDLIEATRQTAQGYGISEDIMNDPSVMQGVIAKFEELLSLEAAVAAPAAEVSGPESSLNL